MEDRGGSWLLPARAPKPTGARTLRRIRIGRWIGGILAAAALLAAGLALSTIPARGGRARVGGISGRVTIETDRRGVPVIRGGSLDDVLFGLGWVHARERLWQMEFQRRVGAGRLAEVLGPKLLPTDRFLRTVGFRRAAESALASLSPGGRSRIAAYRSGINAYLASTGRRPPEARMLRVDVAPFDDVDCVVWLKMMAWDLSGNAAAEIRRARLTAQIGARRTAELYVAAPSSPTILRDGEWVVRGGAPAPQRPAAAARPPRGNPMAWVRLARAFHALDPLSFGGEEIGSNSWVVSGSRTASGKPLLANDPHLGLRAPGVFFLARLEAPGFSAQGATLPGVPGVIIGQTDRIAWGLTALEPDVEDLFVERPDPADPSRYLWKGQSLAFERRIETILVRGAKAERLEVRASVHGPVVTDVLAGASRFGGAVTLRWTGLDPEDRTIESLFAIETAHDWAGFLSGAALLHCPSMNLVYADRDGHIGYTASGAIPIRPRADGLQPVSGEGEDDWLGTIPFEDLPRTLDPPRGYLVTANHRVVSERYPWPLSRDPVEPYRARRIEDRLLALPHATAADMKAIQQDRVSYQARDLLPLLLPTRPADDASRDALERLRRWNADFSPDSAAAAIYAAWYAELSTMPEDELGEPAASSVRSRFLIDALAANSPWCDDVRTPARETCDDFRTATLARAVAKLRKRLGPSPDAWRWETLHRARFPHAVLDGVPLLSRLASLEIGQGGDASTVNVGAYRRDGTFRMTDGPSYRQVVDFGELTASRYVATTGQSGNFLERGYRDFLPMWRKGEYFGINGRPGEGILFVLDPR